MITKFFSLSDDSSRSLYRYGIFIIGLVLIAVSLYCRIRLLDAPLERDEGGFAYIGQQMLRGVPPYLSGNMKVLPGIHFAYAGIMMVFGETTAGIHLGLLVVNILSIALLFLLARRMFTLEASVLAAGTFARLTVSQSVFGVFAHATHFVVLCALAGLLLLLKAVETKGSRYFFAAGFCLGASVLMKQHGIFLCLFGVCYLAADTIFHKKSYKALLHQLSLLLIGMSIPYAAVCFYMYTHGVWSDFWFWTVTYSLQYAAPDSSTDWMSNLRFYFRNVSLNILFFWLLSLGGLALALYPQSRVQNRWFISSFLLFSILAVLPGFAFYPHYFVVLLPSLSLLAAVVVESLPKIMAPVFGLQNTRAIVFIALLSVTLFSLSSRSSYLFTLSPDAVSRSIYGLNPFPESQAIAQYIQSNTEPGTEIAVLGSEPQIYFYADRPSASDCLYMYPLVEHQKYAEMMQEEMIRQIEASAPEYIVFAMVPTSWMFDENSGMRLQIWIEKYLRENYQQVGVVELRYYGNSQYYWDEEAYDRQPASEQSVLVYRKNEAG